MSGTGTTGGNLQGFPQNSSPVVDKNNELRWTQPWLQFMITLWRRTGTAIGAAVNYPGQFMAFAGPDLPPGYLLADGTAVDRIIYAALFNSIGTTWGTGDGATTFNLPNLVNRVLVGAGTLPLGSRGGAIPTTGGTIGYAAVQWAIKT